MDRMTELYRELRKRYGKPGNQWSLWCKRPKSLMEKELVIMEAILTQRANWKNVQIAVTNLKNAGIVSLKKISQADTERLSGLIRPSGFYRQKTERLKALAEFFTAGCGGIRQALRIPADIMRENLLRLKGVGKETADDILLYSLEKPVFVIDEYTKRFVSGHGISRDLSYDGLKTLFEGKIKRDYRLYQDFHALIVMDGKTRS